LKLFLQLALAKKQLYFLKNQQVPSKQQQQQKNLPTSVESLPEKPCET